MGDAVHFEEGTDVVIKHTEGFFSDLIIGPFLKGRLTLRQRSKRAARPQFLTLVSSFRTHGSRGFGTMSTPNLASAPEFTLDCQGTHVGDNRAVILNALN